MQGITVRGQGREVRGRETLGGGEEKVLHRVGTTGRVKDKAGGGGRVKDKAGGGGRVKDKAGGGVLSTRVRQGSMSGKRGRRGSKTKRAGVYLCCLQDGEWRMPCLLAAYRPGISGVQVEKSSSRTKKRVDELGTPPILQHGEKQITITPCRVAEQWMIQDL